MTSRERINAAVRREIPDRVPRDISWGLAPQVQKIFEEKTGEVDPFSYFRADHRFVRISPTEIHTDFTPYHEASLLPLMEVNEWGVGLKPGDDTAFHFKHIISPLKSGMTLEQAVDYELPDLADEYRFKQVPGIIRGLHDSGLAATAPLDQTIFEMAWQIRGFEELMMDMMTEEEAAEVLLERITELRIKQAVFYAEAGVDVLMLGDDIGTQANMLMSPELWRKHLKPKLARVISAALSVNPGLPVFYHSDGVIYPVIEDLIEIGVTVLNPVQPLCMDPAGIKKGYGDRLAFWGTIDVQQTLPFGTPEDVRMEVRQRMETVGKDGGFVIGPTHMIEPEVPWENIIALHEAIDEFGNYT